MYFSTANTTAASHPSATPPGVRSTLHIDGPTIAKIAAIVGLFAFIGITTGWLLETFSGLR
jgi:hypothetical protein